MQGGSIAVGPTIFLGKFRRWGSLRSTHPTFPRQKLISGPVGPLRQTCKELSGSSTVDGLGGLTDTLAPRR